MLWARTLLLPHSCSDLSGPEGVQTVHGGDCEVNMGRPVTWKACELNEAVGLSTERLAAAIEGQR